MEKLSKSDFSIIARAEEITKCAFTTHRVKDNYYMEGEELLNVIDHVLDEYYQLEEKYTEFKRNVEDNYRQIPVAEQYGISDKDFI